MSSVSDGEMKPVTVKEALSEKMCPWCCATGVDFYHVKTCSKMPPDGLERMQRAKRQVAESMTLLADRDFRKRETLEEYNAYIKLFGREALKGRLPNAKHYDVASRAQERLYVKALGESAMPIAIRGHIFHRMQLRFPELLKTLLGADRVRDLEPVRESAAKYAEDASGEGEPAAT